MRPLTVKVVILSLLIISLSNLCQSAGRSKAAPLPSSSSLSIAVHPERVQLLQDALSWLTLRKNGHLLSEQENKPYLHLLVEKYKKSKYYRTLVIAFQHGVLPKLTLDFGATCNPEYTHGFKNPFNQSVTDFSIKNFTFQSYYSRNNPIKMGTSAYCDYRKGLRCSQTTKKCECPPGSVMSPIGGGGGGPGSRSKSAHVKQACLLKNEEFCALIDLEHSTTHNILMHYLPIMIFNLEKPLGCQDGLHCRLGVDDYNSPKCYGEDLVDEFDTGDIGFDYGRKCTLNLYTDDRGGMCGRDLTCFNFGPRSHPKTPENYGKTGYCAREQGEFIGVGAGRQMIKHGHPPVLDLQPFVIPFVNPRTTSWSSDEHQSALSTYLGRLQDVNKNYFKVTQQDLGGGCSVERTRKMGELWNFYVELEQQPPSGTKFVATTNELNAKMMEIQSLVKGPGKICRVNLNIATAGGLADNNGPAMTCVSSGGTADAEGNDGTCLEAPPSADTSAAANRLKEFIDYENTVRESLAKEEQNYDQNILGEFPEAGCSPQLGSAERIRAKAKGRHLQVDVLEGGACPHGSVCYENLDDARGIYAGHSCQFIPSYRPEPACHSVNEGLSAFGKCEKEILAIRVMEALAGVHDHSMLGNGDTCQYSIEQKIKQAILGEQADQNPYVVLNMINVGKAKGGFCDPTRLLECSSENKCRCIQNSKVRRTENGVTSDYCYLTKGSCKSDLKKLLPTSAIQKEMIKKQYGNLQEIEGNCKNGNICMFVDIDKKECTAENTGKTGYEGNPRLDRSNGMESTGGGGGSGKILGKLSFYPGGVILKVLLVFLFT